MNFLSFLNEVLSNKDKVLKDSENQDRGIRITTFEGGERHVCPYYSELHHPDFNEGEALVVNQYFSEKDALKGHAQLVTTFITRKYHPESVDVFFNRSLGIKSDQKIQSGICLSRDVLIH